MALLHHAAFFVIVILSHLFLPTEIDEIVFSQAGVLVIGSIIPVYGSIVSICTIDGSDDKAWLQYWIASGVFTYCTEWMDVVAEHYPSIAESWYKFELFTILWLLLPYTQGAKLFHKRITDPYLTPIAQSMKTKLDNQVPMFFFIINSGYLWTIWFVFMTLEEEAKRFIVIAVGTIYPIVASMVAITTQDYSEGLNHQITFWLTYWCCFTILFIMMDYLETFVGEITGFYSLCLCATVYLFLPMFNGADAVFRNILVPLSGQEEQLFLRDFNLMKVDFDKKQKKKNISKQRQDALYSRIVKMVQEGRTDKSD